MSDKMSNPADLWDAYCTETPAKRRSPQGAMAFAFGKLTAPSRPENEGSVRDAMREMGEQTEPVREHLRRMVAEFHDYHYQTCPADDDSGRCNCFAGALLERAAAALATPPAAAGREEIAKAIRNALVENWNDAANARKWDEDVLLTGCRKVGGGMGYQDPQEAAQRLALDAADAVLALGATLTPQDGQAELLFHCAACGTLNSVCPPLEDRAAVIEECAKVADHAFNLMFPKPMNRITAENTGHAVAAAIRSLAPKGAA